MASGRAPAKADEAALGAATARRLHKGIGDTIEVTSAALSSLDQQVTITGIAVLNDPVSSGSNAGDGVVLHPDVALGLDIGQVSQSIVVRLDPSADRQAAIQSVVRDFPGSARLAQPQTDLANLQRLRFAPWLIATLVGALALASLIHALVTLLQRHAGDLAVLGALGLTRRQRRRVGLAASLVIVTGCVLLGVPVGLVLGQWIWRVVARRISIPSGPVMAWAPTVMAPIVAVLVASAVATLAARWVTRRSPTVQLRTE
jgi:predicted lysophospholipase L1 biosynthesis ABC-type transport system permease subunit